MTELPLIREELNRKAFEAVEWLIVGADKGKISKAQFCTGIEAVFMTASGLLDESIVDLITNASAACHSIKASDKRYFTKGGAVVTLEWCADEYVFNMVARTATGGRSDTERSFDTPVIARDSMAAVAVKLVAAGYEEI